MEDLELKVMGEIASGLEKLSENLDAQKRVLNWLNQRFNFTPIDNRGAPFTPKGGSFNPGGAVIGSNELEGIALQTADDEFKITLRDLKAKNKIDAANRLIHVSILAYQTLKNQSAMPSKTLVKILEDWRFYDGNTRGLIASHKGMIKTKDGYVLDVHAKREAENFIKEILDNTIVGSWSPGSKSNKKNK